MKIATEKSRLYSLVNPAADVFLLIASFFLAYLFIWGHFRPDLGKYFITASVALLFCWSITALLLRLYAGDRNGQFGRSLPKHFLALIIHAVFLSLLVFLVAEFSITRILFIFSYLLFVFLDTLLRLCLIYVVRLR